MIAESRTNTKISQKHKHFHKERGALFPQIKLSFTMCIGAISFGLILNWGGAIRRHLNDLIRDETVDKDYDYAWVLSTGPLGIAVGTAIWAFFSKRFGPKNTLLCHTPFMILSWFLMYYFKTYKTYWSAHFMTSLCSASYMYVGETFLNSCIHRNNLKTIFAIFTTCPTFGILIMDIIEPHLDQFWLCIIGTTLCIVCFLLTADMYDSPFYLIQVSKLKAEDSLKYYSGKESIAPKLNILKQHLNFSNFGSYNKHMLSAKVVLKAIAILTFLHLFKTSTGYYAFVLDSLRIFEADSNVVNPYVDNLIFKTVLFTTKLIACFVNLHVDFGVKKPMMISMFLCSIILFAFGTIRCLQIEWNYKPMTGTILIILCLFSFTYDLGMCLCSEQLLYAYIPHQIYDFLKNMSTTVNWTLTFLVVRIYLACKTRFGLYVVLWSFSAVTMIGFCFIVIFIVDIKGKALLSIQMELGGNPVGTRGSTRQRMASPYENLEKLNCLQHLIEEDLKRAAKEDHANSTKK